MITGAQVAEIALEYLGTPFVHEQRCKGVGIDCAGVVICVGREAGSFAPTFDVRGYGRRPEQRFLSELKRNWDQVDAPDVGGMVSFAFAGRQMHVGILVSLTEFVHSLTGHGVILSMLAGDWYDRKRGYWRYRGVCYD